jgi:APA family basic amino acid/polyamine antiporter
VGWSLILEYSLVVSTVAVGWSGYATGFLHGLGVDLPAALTAGPHAGGIVNLPAVLITFVVAGLLTAGTRESATLNAVLVVAKIIALGVFVAMALPHFDAANLHPFMPYGFAKTMGADGVERGVMAAAAIIFFAFYGFDAISTAAEETKNPARDLSIGIVGSMVGCTLIYVLVALAAVGALSFTVFGHSAEPLALILRELGQGGAARVIAAVAVIALPTVLLAFLYGQSRIFFVMSRDGLLPRGLSKVNAHRHAGGDHLVHRGAGGRAGRRGAAGRNRGAGQCRHADRLRRGGRVPAGAARARAAPTAAVPGAAGLGGRPGGDPRLCISVLQPAGAHPAVVPGVERDRPAGLPRLGPAPRGAGPGWRCLSGGTAAAPGHRVRGPGAAGFSRPQDGCDSARSPRHGRRGPTQFQPLRQPFDGWRVVQRQCGLLLLVVAPGDPADQADAGRHQRHRRGRIAPGELGGRLAAGLDRTDGGTGLDPLAGMRRQWRRLAGVTGDVHRPVGDDGQLAHGESLQEGKGRPPACTLHCIRRVVRAE